MAWNVELSEAADRVLSKLDPQQSKRILKFLHQRIAKLDDLMPGLTGSSRDEVREVLNRPGFSGQITAKEVRRLAASGGTSIDALMVDLLPAAQMYSRPPISDFRVGAVVRGS